MNKYLKLAQDAGKDADRSEFSVRLTQALALLSLAESAERYVQYKCGLTLGERIENAEREREERESNEE